MCEKRVCSLRAQRRAFVACGAAFVHLFVYLLHAQRRLSVACAAAFVCCLGSGVRSLHAQWHAFVACGRRLFVHLQRQERKIETKKDTAFLPVE